MSASQQFDINKNFFKYLVYYPVLFVRRESIVSYSKFLKRSQYWSAEQLRELQLERLNRLLNHARTTVPHYREALPTKLENLEELKQIPLLEKDTVRLAYQQLLSSKPGVMTRAKTTGGSTGAPVTIRKNSRGMAQELAATWRGYRWANVDIGDRQARFWGVPQQKSGRRKAKLIDFVGDRVRLSAFAYSDDELSRYVKILSEFRPSYFYGYVSVIRHFAEYVEKNNLQSLFSIKAIVTTSEVLSQRDRDYFSKVFSAPVFNEYGCGEIGTIAHECPKGKMHINAENMIVEILRPDGTSAEIGESGEIVVTDLCNFSMPLIRYRMKDFGVLDPKVCDCGRGLPVLGEVHGREYDVLVNAEGKKFHGGFFLYMLEDLKSKGFITQGVQIEQTSLEKLVIKIVSPDSAFNVITDEIEKKIKTQFNPDAILDFQRVEFIPRESSGKLRVVKRSF